MRVKARRSTSTPVQNQAMEAGYAYDNEGRRASMTYPPAASGGTSPRVLNYTYDNMGRPVGMTEAASSDGTVTSVRL